MVSEGKVDLSCFVSKVASLSDGVEWFEKLSAKDGGKYMKVILQP